MNRININDYLIDNGKNPDDFVTFENLISLPADTPYGNFNIKYMKIIKRLDEANRNIKNNCKAWQIIRTDGNFYEQIINTANNYDLLNFSGEAIVYHLRKVADEIISLVWSLKCYTNNGKYPSKIKYDCIGAYLKESNKEFNEFKEYIWLFDNLNQLANAYKHSFINSDIDVIGDGEPCLPALALDYNNLANNPHFYIVSLKKIVKEYNVFFTILKK